MIMDFIEILFYMIDFSTFVLLNKKRECIGFQREDAHFSNNNVVYISFFIGNIFSAIFKVHSNKYLGVTISKIAQLYNILQQNHHNQDFRQRLKA